MNELKSRQKKLSINQQKASGDLQIEGDYKGGERVSNPFFPLSISFAAHRRDRFL